MSAFAAIGLVNTFLVDHSERTAVILRWCDVRILPRMRITRLQLQCGPAERERGFLHIPKWDELVRGNTRFSLAKLRASRKCEIDITMALPHGARVKKDAVFEKFVHRDDPRFRRSSRAQHPTPDTIRISFDFYFIGLDTEADDTVFG
jgi:hypothetical protein